jgi:hypothetical protein
MPQLELDLYAATTSSTKLDTLPQLELDLYATTTSTELYSVPE